MYHLSAEIGEYHGGQGTCYVLTEVDHPYAVKNAFIVLHFFTSV